MNHNIRSGADVEAKDHDGRTALHYATIVGVEEACHILIRCGADPHAQDIDLETPLVGDPIQMVHWHPLTYCT